ncbi:S8 family serine peptidase [Candidatus Woesearchaeota archaeon]|nr:S8 family serine peptidase [Candidatus Woesearchaeota archaeon]
MQKKLVILLVFCLFASLASASAAYALSDAFEPDNNHTHATFINTNGVPQTHNFSSSTDADYVKFNTTAGLVYFIKALNLTATSTTDTVLALYDTDGTTRLVENDDIEPGVVRFSQIAWKAPTSGTYFVNISEFSGNVDGNYNISVQEYGYLEAYALTPNVSTNVTRYRFFNFSAGVKCVGGSCLNIRATLDPFEAIAKPATAAVHHSDKVDKRLFAILQNQSKAAVIIKLRDDDIAAGEKAYLQAKTKQIQQSQRKGKKLLGAAKDAGVSLEERQALRKSLIKSQQEEVLDALQATRLDIREFMRQREQRIKSEAAESKEGGMVQAPPEQDDDSEFDLKFQYSTVNQLAGDVSWEGIEKLVTNPDVEFVYLDGEVKAALSDSVPLINADDVRAVVVTNNITGAGQTVCVIDTGINFTHPDFGSCNFTSNINDRSCSKVIGGYDFVNSDENPADDNSHGSHVAGIVASEDSTYKGVAPGANLVAIKVLNAAGSGSFSDVIAGIDWCVNNASRLNITVITMSLGDSGRQSAHCDAHSSGPSILNAVANGIFVAIASGNDGYGLSSGNTAGISAPACVSNATSVGASSKADAITSYSNRGLLLDLLAPGGISGSSIVATSHTGGHTGKLGTSMATPHVAGAAALIQQHYREKFNQNASPLLIEHALKFNGVPLADAGTGLTFTRINALDAVTSKGDISTVAGALPFYTISPNPGNASCLRNLAVNATCNVTWTVNATGNFTNYEFFAIFEMDYGSNSSPKFNVTIFNNVPTLTMGAVSPGSGNNSTLFNFTVNYTDADNETPLFVNVTVLANTFSLAAADSADVDVVDGKIFFVNRTIRKGNNYFFFSTGDGVNTTVTTNQSGPNITNVAPQLNTSNPVSNATWLEDTVNISTNLTRHFFDLDNDALNFTATPVAGIAVVIDNDTGIVTLTPAANFTGIRTVNFTATDGINSTQSNEVTLTVVAVNDAPSLNASNLVRNITWPQDTSNTTINLSANFFDVDGDDLNFTAASVDSITVTVNNDSGLVNLTPAAGFVGLRSVIFTASDPSGLSTQGNNVTLNVTDARPPAITLNTPVDKFNTSTSRQEFNFTPQDNFDLSLLCNLTIDGVSLNSTATAANGSVNLLSGNLSADGNHIWNITCTDDQNNQNTSSTRTIGRDTSVPTVNLVAPADAASLPSNVSSFSFNFTDAFSSAASCSLFVNNTNKSTNASVVNFTLTSFSPINLSEGNNTWYVNCTDLQGNSARSLIRSVRVPRDTSNESANFTAQVTKSVAATARSDVNLSLLSNVSGSIAVGDYSLNPANLSATTGNGFAALGLPIFLEITADANVTYNLSWMLITIFYTDAELPSTLNESTLRLYFFNESSQRWVQESNSGVNITGNFVFGNITHFSFFSAGGSAQVSGGGDGSDNGGGVVGGGGGGGGGGAAASSDLSVDPSGDGASVSAGLNQKINVNYAGEVYTFRIVTLTSTIVGVRHISTSKSIYLLAGQTSAIDLDGDGADDVEVIAVDISSTQAILLFREMVHAIPAQPAGAPVAPTKKEATPAQAQVQNQTQEPVVKAVSADENKTGTTVSKRPAEEKSSVITAISSLTAAFSGIFAKLLIGVLVFVLLAAIVVVIARKQENLWFRKSDYSDYKQKQSNERGERRDKKSKK